MEYKEQPRAKRKIELLDPTIYSDQLTGESRVELSRDEIDHFKEQGFIVKRNLIEDRSSLERIVDYVWQTVPRNTIVRDDPTTWLDRPQDRWTDEEAARVGRLAGTMWKMRSPHAIGTESIIVDNTANHPCVRTVVEQFLCSSIRQCERVRGVYLVLPKPVESEGRLGPHADHAAAELCAMVLVDDVPPRCGGFTVWPTSHRRLHPFWTTRYGAHFAPTLREHFAEEQAEILNTVAPVEFSGSTGDVVFWHPRLLHSAGVNHSAEFDSPIIRYVVPCDFQRVGTTRFDDDEVGPGEKEQWWVDTRHYEEDVQPTTQNMWDGWIQ